MLKHIKISLLSIGLAVIFAYCQNNKPTGEVEYPILFDSQTNSYGILLEGLKEGVWKFKLSDSIHEFKCYSNGKWDSISLSFLVKNNKKLPLGVIINNHKEGIWLNYANLVDSLSAFNFNKELPKNNIKYTVLTNGRKAIESWTNDVNKKTGLHLTYNDTNLIYVSSYSNDTMNGVFMTIPLKEDSTYSCGCTKNGYLHGYSSSYYLDDKIASFGSFLDGKPVGIWSYFSKQGKLLKKIDYNSKTPKIIYGPDSNTFLPPPPPPPSSNNKIEK